ncbi:Chitinase [Fulvivirga imtechensis AK7]|uniref:chitinase n=1 Tax=Fulvivirga imtechensis AK7 TaxID=1237149 RepID=L8JW79_9BACT|nr:glycosyl hydrolase family 18 protein [Fulvivirga imtechensis]ELR73276.1 Chitinase [Fulvivirga imtechensis AK7]
MIKSHYLKLSFGSYKLPWMLALVILASLNTGRAQQYSATWTQGQRLMPDFTGTLKVTNHTSSAVEDYHVEFELDAHYLQVTSYSGTVTSLGNNRYKWEPPSWGGGTSLGANASVDISVNAKYAGISIPPFNATIQGANISATGFEVENLSPLFPSPCGQPQCDPAPGYDPSMKVIAYYISWGVYGRNFHVQNLRADKMTHINFAFANINPSTYRIVVGDEFADLQKEGGSFDKLYQLKQYYPHLKTLISVGGWTWSTHFYEAAATAANRQAFAESVREFLVKYKFDGVDLDWEYPGGGGNDTGKGGPEDGANYTRLVQAIRAELDAQEAIDGKQYLITAAVGAGTSKINAMDVQGFFAAVDWANIMTYDMNGAWANYTGHHAPLYNSAGDGVGTHPDGSPVIDPKFNVHSAISHYMADGAPANKITVGLPIYSREWRDVAAGDSHGLYQQSSASQPPPGSWDEPGQPSGVHDYKDLVASYINKNGYTRYWDDVASVPYLYNPNQLGGHFISYEDTESLGHKISYIHQNNLAGAMYWEGTQDVPSGPNSLIDKIYSDVMAGGCSPNCPNVDPQVSIVTPANGSTFVEGTDITITASASDPDGHVVLVEFYGDGQKLGEDNSAPYSFTWSGAAVGVHEIAAIATDNDNASTISSAVTIEVTEQGSNQPPSVSITAPADGTVFTTADIITITAEASDADGSVLKVEFFEGNNKLGENSSAPYTFNWSGVVTGSYSITARATDNEGLITTSPAVHITVEQPDTGGCDGLPQYVAGSSYSQDQDVQNIGNKYNCNIPGWCSSSAAWAYEPGVGQHWQDGWSLLGPCGDGTGNARPSVSISAPANNASFDEGENISFSALASDSDGTIALVEYFRGTTKIGESATSPYTVTWTNAAVGTYSITAKATDDQGAQGTSSPISITVNSNSTGGDCEGIAVWSASAIYHGGDQVQFNGNKYQANYWTQNNNPEEFSDPYEHWTLVGPCSSASARLGHQAQHVLENIPVDFVLRQNYPNPFTENTTIEFSLPEKHPVSLVIYNSVGEEVMRITDGNPEPGKYSYELNTTNWSKGLYYYQLTYKANVTTLKMRKE